MEVIKVYSSTAVAVLILRRNNCDCDLIRSGCSCTVFRSSERNQSTLETSESYFSPILFLLVFSLDHFICSWSFIL